MRNWYWLAALCFVIACSEEKTDLSGNTPLKINDFNKVFKTVTLPINISDTNLAKVRDTIKIGAKALAQFVPDSVVEKIIPEKDQKAILYPLLKIEKETEYYLMLNVHHPKKEEIAVVVFSKKNAYLDYKIITQFLVEQKGSRNYGKSVSINREPTFLVEENKMDEENVLIYEKNGWAFTENHFRLIYFDSNKKPESKTIINPIDTLSTNNTYSGDYARDAKNFI
jgi:hypothetical protein